jgi:hypothetical protein
VNVDKAETKITLDRIGKIPMPLEVLVTFANGTQELYYIALSETLGSKSKSDTSSSRKDLPTWNWVNPSYTFTITGNVKSLEIDPGNEIADINRSNNKFEIK